MFFNYIYVDDAINDLDTRLCFLLLDYPSCEEKISFDGKLVLTLEHLEKNALFDVPLKVISLDDLLTGGAQVNPTGETFSTAIFQQPIDNLKVVGNFEINGTQKKYVAEFYYL